MLAIVLATGWIAIRIARPGTPPETDELDLSEINFNVALVETGGSHDEVTAALYHAIGSVAGVHTSMYLALPRFGIQNVYAWMYRRYKLSPYSISPPHQLRFSDAGTPDVIILATCEHDVFDIDTALHSFFEHGPSHQTLICVMHHTDRLKATEVHLRRWAHTSRLRFITLSKHPAENLRKELNILDKSLYGNIPIDSFPPIFPVPLDPNPPVNENITISIQGNFEDTRRDYLKTLLEFERMLDELPDSMRSRIQLVLAGHGTKVGIPAKVMPYISVNFSLDYIPFYNLLSTSFALIPAFADESYYETKASSSVPASFIARAPILGSKRLLEAYGYLENEVIWDQDGVRSESEMSAIYEILRHHFDNEGIEKSSWKQVVQKKKQLLRKRALELMKDNALLMRDIILKQGSR
jgi:hypothetical protein